VWKHAKSLLIESHKGHHVSYRRGGEPGVLQHLTSLKLRHHHKPMLNEFLQMVQSDDGRSPVLLYHDSGRKEGQHLQDFGISSLFHFSFFFFRRLML
jgi:hypothetical protein